MQESLQSTHNFDFERVLIESLQRLDTSLLEPSSASEGTLENSSNEEVTTLKDELKQREDQCERLELDRSQLSLQLEAAEVGPESKVLGTVVPGFSVLGFRALP